MTTNRDWLFGLPLEEQYAWMNAEHVESPTSRETAQYGQVYQESGERALESDTAALNAKIAELTAERDKLQEQLLIGWECECRLQAERERYRSLFGKCIDYADAIHALMDEIDEGWA